MLEYGIIFPRVVLLVRVLVLFCCLQYGTASVCCASFNGLRLTIIDELVQTVSSKRVDAASSLRVTRYIDELDVTMPEKEMMEECVLGTASSSIDAEHAITQSSTPSGMGQQKQSSSVTNVFGAACKDVQRLPSNISYYRRREKQRSLLSGSSKDIDLSSSARGDEQSSPSGLRMQLAQDALDIHSEEPDLNIRKNTTCLCVALLDKHGSIRKFSFHNEDTTMQSDRFHKAEELGYDVIQAERSHAEGQLLQYLLSSSKENPGLYTHILGIGCNRQYCSECGHLFASLLGSDYYKICTASALRSVVTKRSCQSVRDSEYTNQGVHTVTMSTEFSILLMKKAIGRYYCSKFYLPNVLREALEHRFNCQISFEHDRFGYSSSVVKKRGRP